MTGLRKLIVLAVVGVMVAAFAGFYLVNAAAPHATVSAVATTHDGSPTHLGHSALGAEVIKNLPSNSFLTCTFALSQCYYSLNWGGYVVYNSSYLVTKVSASWTVPTIAGATATTCPDAQSTWDSNSAWIGIDGAFDGTVEQTGTSADCFYGTPAYYAWYEFYPAGSNTASFAIHPGDKITATVTYKGLNSGSVPTFQTTLKDTTTSNTLTSPVTAVSGALRNSAEWIDESPYYDGYLGLTNVSKITFTAASATINGHTHAILGSSWGANNVYWFISVDYNFPNTLVAANAKGEPGKLNSTGTSFSVTWLTEGP